MTLTLRPDPSRALEVRMGRVAYPITIENFSQPEHRIECPVAIIDTGAYCLTLPAVWKEKLGSLPLVEEVKVQTADGRVVDGELCGPLKIRIGTFEAVVGSALFVEMEPEDGRYTPLVGFLTLEQARLTVDLVFHRLMRIPYVDMRSVELAT